jgi:hypothetical protein
MIVRASEPCQIRPQRKCHQGRTPRLEPPPLAFEQRSRVPLYMCFRISAGLAEAALTDWNPTVRMAWRGIAGTAPDGFFKRP